ncbi:MAG: phage tail protein [Sphingobium sp.]
MATLVLTVVGTALGGPIGGAIGALAGQVIDNTLLFPPKGRQGPRLPDLRLQTSRYGDQIPRLFGTIRVAGSVIWATDLQEHRSRQGGGKGQPKVTTYSYSASFAVALSARRIVSVQRIWADGNLLRGSAGDFKTGVGAFRLYDGNGDQGLDPLIAADKGLSTTPAHRGTAYAVFEDLQLADYGNRIPSLTFEVVADSGAVFISDVAADISGGAIAGSASGDRSVSGFAAAGSSVSDTLSPLVDAFGLALRTEGGGLALEAAGAIEGTIGADQIGGRFNGRDDRGKRSERARAEDIPVRIAARHYDAGRDYQAGVQTAERTGAGRREATLDLPAVLDSVAARALAETRLNSLWTGRTSLTLRCDWRALTLVPGAVVTVADEPGRWRIEQSEWDGVGVRLDLRQVGGGGVVAPPSSGGSAVAQTDRLHGPTTLVAADLPMPDDALLTAPLVVVAAAGIQPGWRAAELFAEDSATGGLTSIGGSAPPAILGAVVSPPEAMASYACFDAISALDVQLLNGTMQLSGASDAALLAGANSVLAGQEVIQFGSAIQTGPDTWRLSRLLRGRRGTEWAMMFHMAGEQFLLIDDDSLFQVPSVRALPGATLELAAIGIGDTVPATATVAVLSQAILPLSPVHTSAVLSAGDWQFSWIRRSRAGWSWYDGADAPLGEEQELYRISLLQGGLAFRTVETAWAGWTYDAASIAADAVTGPVNVEIRQIGTYGAGRPAFLQLTL